MFSLGCARLGLIFYLLSFVFCLFLFGLCRANFFSFVAHAATGPFLLVPSRGFVSGLRVLSPAAFSRAFAPGACLPVVRFVCAVPSCFGCLFAYSVLVARAFSSYLLSFVFSCLTSFSQTSFHLSLRPRRASTFFRKESRQRFAKGLRPFEPHSCALRVDLPFPRAAGRLKRPFGPQTAGR